MSIEFKHHVELAVGRHGVIGRRDFFKGISLAGVAAGTLTWADLVSLRANELRREGMACIVLWMQGGPSQFETFNPKPDHENGGETKAIATSVPGIQVADRFPRLARQMDRLAIIRSMTTKEGNHQRASFLMHTGYSPSASVAYPALGAIAADTLADAASDLPAFARIGPRFRNCGGGGFLGVEFDPFMIPKAGALPQNAKPATAVARYQRRLGLLKRLESGRSAPHVTDHRKLYQTASRMILSPRMKAFDLNQEPASMRQAYGDSEFGSGCLLARRLVESGVTFVEVSAGNWDTHADNFPRTQALADQVDGPAAQLLEDLANRGMLERTLVVWMGEFGRTPRINARGGRDHLPKAFNVVLAGSNVRGGQVIGATNDAGTEIVDRPVPVEDLFRSLCMSLKIDPDHENLSPIGRPITVVDGGEAITGLFS